MSGFAKLAWGVLGYNLIVILWGALVRATKSGAGCGGHWPLCNGVVLPEVTEMATVIEFTHRIMSGLALLSAIVLWWKARSAFDVKHPARKWAARSLFFMITEALVGAGLVLWGLVAGDTSVARVYVLGIHLVNTFLLLACLALTAWWAEAPAGSTQKSPSWPMRLALIALTLVAAAGAITALGDTLFPSGSLAEGIRADFESTAHFLVRLRVIHPALAVVVALYTGFVVWPDFVKRSGPKFPLAAAIISLLTVQLAVGAANILMQAPLSVQLIHLLLADLTWISAVLYASDRSALAHDKKD